MNGFERFQCGKCGIEFDVPPKWADEKRAEGDTFYCPNGHPRVFRETTAQQMQREIARLKQREAMYEQEKAALMVAADKAEKSRKRLEERVNAGVCPHCTRTFLDVSRHMKSKHGNVVSLIAEKVA